MPEIIGGAHVTCVKEAKAMVTSGATGEHGAIPELSGFAAARCRRDADRCWSLGRAMRDNGLEAMCSMPVTRALSTGAVG
ncbi:hypothetical protein [Streptomyces mashuensis]|uniref:hypothetical protein n=1 Tax=Streptomyces mashuensis TaxID=33904 RepID=UPI00167DAFCD|nr:hypothetical protein [Streptomyces mashuensis]